MQMTVLKASLAHEEFELNLQAGILDLKSRSGRGVAYMSENK